MISVQIYCYLFFACYCFSVVAKALPVKKDFKVLKESPKFINMFLGKYCLIETTTLGNVDEKDTEILTNASKIRVKRQNSGAGKFADAAKMPQIKLIRLLLQMFKNSWDLSHVGGVHPLHPSVPKVLVTLYKQKVVEFFIPDVGEDPNKQIAT